MKYAFLPALLLLVSTNPYASTLTSLNKEEVTKLLQGNTITTAPIATVDGKLINNTFVGYFNKDGTVQGKFANKFNSQSSNEPQEDNGTWEVNPDGKFCVTWKHWNNNKQDCSHVYGLENGYIVVKQPSGNFESFFLKEGVVAGNKLTS